jgi:HD domain-containing protein
MSDVRDWPRRVARQREQLNMGRLERLFERYLMPPIGQGELSDALADAPARPDDFRRIVYFVALAAVGFFVPSLLLANVPIADWPLFTVSAAAAGILIGGSFVVVRQGSRLGYVAVVINALTLGGLATQYGSYYNQLGLAFAMVVGAHAILHGLGPAMLGVLLGGALVPFVIQAGQAINATDPVYAVIYLFGAAILPWSGRQLARRRAVALRQQLALTEATEREAVMILARAAEAKDEVTGDHVTRVGDLSFELGQLTGMSRVEAEDLRFAAMLHDVGKLHLPDSILTKPGRLTRDEWQLVQMHTIWGERILGSTAGFELARTVARSHHENFDGTGYPDGLSGTVIPLAARIAHLADVFDALRSDRPYKRAWPIERCLTEIEQRSGTLFDPDLAELFLELVRGGSIALEAAYPAEPRAARGVLKPRRRRAAFKPFPERVL